MKKITISSQFSVYNSASELPNDIQELMAQAISVRKKAYAPYSNFLVGAALLLENGQVIIGNNQEIADYFGNQDIFWGMLIGVLSVMVL